MFCLCVEMMIRGRFNGSHDRRSQEEDMARQAPPSREISQENIEMSALNTIP